MQKLTRIEKLNLCGIDPIYLYAPLKFSYTDFKDNILAKFNSELPCLYEYCDCLFWFGIHLYNQAKYLKNGPRREELDTIIKTLHDYKRLLGKHKDIFNKSMVGKKKRREKDYIIIKQNLEQELRKYNVHVKYYTNEEVLEKIEAGDMKMWFRNFQVTQLLKNPYLANETITMLTIREYRKRFPEFVEEMDLDHINKYIELAIAESNEYGYTTKHGRVRKDFEHSVIQRLWFILTIDEEIKNLHKEETKQYNQNVRFKFIHKYMTYFKLHDLVIGPGSRSTEEKQIAAMWRSFNRNIINEITDVQAIKNRINARLEKIIY